MYILETVKKIWNKFDEITKRWTKTHYLLLTSFVLILTYIVFGVQAENNDDPGMMQYISGFLTGKPDILPYTCASQSGGSSKNRPVGTNALCPGDELKNDEIIEKREK